MWEERWRPRGTGFLRRWSDDRGGVYQGLVIKATCFASLASRFPVFLVGLDGGRIVRVVRTG
jgi:hypothetical protein